MLMPMRSLIEPPGFWFSSFRYSSQAPASRRRALTMGVSPMSSRTEEWIDMLRSRNNTERDYRIVAGPARPSRQGPGDSGRPRPTSVAAAAPVRGGGGTGGRRGGEGEG